MHEAGGTTALEWWGPSSEELLFLVRSSPHQRALLRKTDAEGTAPGACVWVLGRWLGHFECGGQILLSTHGPSSLSHHAHSQCHVKPQTPEDKAWGPMQYGSVLVASACYGQAQRW